MLEILRDSGSMPGSGKSDGRGLGSPPPVFLLGESHGQRNLVWATVHRVTKSQTKLKQFSMHAHVKHIVNLNYWIYLQIVWLNDTNDNSIECCDLIIFQRDCSVKPLCTAIIQFIFLFSKCIQHFWFGKHLLLFKMWVLKLMTKKKKKRIISVRSC